ncbi:MAG: 4-hydroxythreonine-4-phosphate dehydrogenase PdxA [Bacteroidales bacterium]|nr:4-hydroxythreonine-4-phosphate dehydrogenase PdxA [Bacteroidales bacterium]
MDHIHEVDNEPKIKVGVSHGDFNGISYEIIIKTFSDQRVLELMTPVVYGSSKVASYHRKVMNVKDFNFNLIKKPEQAAHRRANLLNIFEEEVKIELGKPSQIAGELAVLSLDAAATDLIDGKIDVLVTAPFNKQTIQSEDFHFPGHTEYLARKFESDDYLMLMVSGNLRIGMVTGHIPLQDVPTVVTENLLLRKIRIMHESLIRDFGITKPKIAILAMNPHASDQGLIGDEEQKVLIPTIERAQQQGKLVFGPFPADGFFGSNNFTQFDGVLAMYHDQGMLPFKTMAFESGVNYTAGLPFIRTSPAHGTAYEIAGKGEAQPDSFRAALYLAKDIFANRKQHDEISRRPLRKQRLDETGIIDELPENNDQKDELLDTGISSL